jgi:hypothetical protein
MFITPTQEKNKKLKNIFGDFFSNLERGVKIILVA